jgi:hypothetical protein
MIFNNGKIEIPSLENFEQDTLNYWNTLGNFNVALNEEEYKTSSLRLVLKTAEQHLIVFTAGLLQIPVQITQVLTEANIKINTSLILKDNQNKYFKDNNLNFFVLDFLDAKIKALPIVEQGVYFVSKDIPSATDQQKFTEIIGDMLPIGVEPKGNYSLEWENINGESKICKIQTTTKQQFYVKLRYKLSSNFEQTIQEFENKLKAEFFKILKENYRVGADFDKAFLESKLSIAFSFGNTAILSDIKIEFSIDNITFLDSSYTVPIDKYLDILEDDIFVSPL